jgi:hypothetical protein
MSKDKPKPPPEKPAHEHLPKHPNINAPNDGGAAGSHEKKR